VLARPKIRVLVVDDSVVTRKILSDTLSSDPALDVVGVAQNGKLGVTKISQCQPDIVTLDIEMPVMNGLQALTEIRKIYPKLPVIMFSTLTESGAAATLEALALGASDYATKPSNTGSPAEAIQRVRAELIPKIKALCPGTMVSRIVRPPVIPHLAHPPRTHLARIEIVAIGTSTGGPNALAALFPTIPKDFPVPIVTVQHMPAIFTKLLADRLNKYSQIPVDEGREGGELTPGRAWIAPGNFHMTVRRSPMRSLIDINQGPPEHSCRPAVDVLFRSVAEAYGPSALAVVMTGMGTDGVLGAQRIREAGGEVIVQDEATSIVWGMPGGTFAAGQADGVYPLDCLGAEITRRVLQNRNSQPMSPLRSSIAPETTVR
jgi:two-component system chemotaxis response regulator CheB